MKKYQKYLIYLILLYAVFGFFVLPFIVKSQAVKLIEQNTYTKASIGSVYINPFLFKIKLSDLNVKDYKQQPLLSFDSLFLDVDLYSLVYGAINIHKLELSKPQLYIRNNADKTLNLLKIVKTDNNTPTQEDNSTGEMPRIKIGEITLDDAQVHYADFTRKPSFYFDFEQIDFELTDIDTNDFNKSDGRFSFYSNLGDGAFLRLDTAIESMQPFGVSGHIDFKANQLYTEWRYIKDMVNFEIADGKASINADFRFDLDDLNATKIENINLTVDNLRLKPKKDSQDIFRLKNLYLSNATLLPMEQNIHISQVGLDGFHINVLRSKEGAIDLQQYFGFESSSEENATQKDSQGWAVSLDLLAIKGLSAKFEDRFVDKTVVSRINDLNMSVKEIALNSSKPFSYKLSTLINDKATCKIDGSLIQKPFYNISNIFCQNFDLPHYNPYIDQAAKESLRRNNLRLDSLLVGTQLHLTAKEEAQKFSLVVKDSQLTFNDLLLRKKSTGEKLVGFESFIFDGINFDLLDQELFVKRIDLNALHSRIKKYKNSRLNIENLVVPKTVSAKKKKTKQEEGLHLHIDEFALNSARVDFTDRSLEKRAYENLNNINIMLFDIDSNKRSWLNYRGSMRINKTGRFYATGKLCHTPLRQQGSFSFKNLSLADINPYLNESTFIKIEDGRLALSGRTRYVKSKKRPDLTLNGKLALNSLFINNVKDDNLLFSLNKLDVKKFTYEFSPDRLFVDEVDVDAFYIDAFVDENKSFNLAKLSKKSDEDTKEIPKKAQKKKEPFDVKIVKVNVSNGSAKFADFSIPIKFQTHIHDINGVVYVLSTKPAETSYINMTGEVDKYGATTLIGSIDSATPKLYTDLDFNFKNLELNAMSGYSATFAGHTIDSGKLYLDLGYDILNSELKGSNAVVIDKIMLGDEVEDENVTHLPLGFAIALLEDNEGIIDLNLPVEGNIDDPDFKYGTVILKAFTNLIVKAVTAPFALLGSMLGIEGEELSYIAFETGEAVITPSQREKLDKIAVMLKKRRKINLGISATYDVKSDLLALKRKKLLDIVIEKSGIKNINEKENALTIDLLEEIYEDRYDDDKLDEIEERLEQQYEDEDKLQRVYQKELLALDISIQKVSQEELLTLAKQRESIIKNYLLSEKSIDAKRLIFTEVKAIDESQEGMVKNILEIKVNK